MNSLSALRLKYDKDAKDRYLQCLILIFGMERAVQVSAAVTNVRAVLTINGRPAVMGRPRRSKHGHFYCPQSREKESTRTQLKGVLFDVMNSSVPVFLKGMKVKVTVCFYYRGKGDIDNFVKFILDVGNGILFHDDEDVDHIDAVKVRVSRDEEMRTDIDVVLM